MLELSNFISKSVLCVNDATHIGTIENVYFENTCKKVAYFLICNNDGERFLLPFDCISNFGDVLTVDDAVCLKRLLDVDLTSFDFDILNKDVYTTVGDFKGKVEKIEFTKSGNIAKIYTATSQFTPIAISIVGDVILLKSTPKQPKKRVTIPRPKTDYPVYILNDAHTSKSQKQSNMLEKSQPSLFDGGQEISNSFNDAHSILSNASFQSTNVLHSAPPTILLSNDDREPMLSSTAFKTLVGIDSFDDDHTPTRIICNFDFLIGRVLSRDLKTFGGDLIAYAGTQVDEDVLQNARRAGKLVELTLNSEKA